MFGTIDEMSEADKAALPRITLCNIEEKTAKLMHKYMSRKYDELTGEPQAEEGKQEDNPEETKEEGKPDEEMTPSDGKQEEQAQAAPEDAGDANPEEAHPAE